MNEPAPRPVLQPSLRTMLAAAASASLVLVLASCSAAYKVELENLTQRTLFAGIIATPTPGMNSPAATGSRVLTSATIRAGETGTFEAKPDSDHQTLTLMVGESPSPGRSGRLFRLEKGANRFKAEQLNADPRSPVLIEPVD